ncbi:MAG: RNA-binding protein [Patescibacteria group bacterium]
MSKRLYVGNLAWATNDDSLRNFFSQAGTVTFAQVIVNKFNGRSKGFGFVEMETDEQAQNAINTLNRQQLDGRMIFVNIARPPREGQGGGGSHAPTAAEPQESQVEFTPTEEVV